MGLFKRFARNESASVFIFFSLAAVPILSLIGAALDYSRASAARVRLQSAIDAAALFAARDSATLTPAQVQTRIRDAVMANLNGKVPMDPAAIIVTQANRNITISATSNVDTTFLKIVNVNTIDIASNTQVAWGTNDIEIALALDNTGSMGWSNKMQELKNALCGDTTCASPNPSAGFIKIMKDAASYDGQIKISLVPFDTGVRMPQNIQNAVNSGAPNNGAHPKSGAGFCAGNPANAQRISWFRFANRDKDAGVSCNMAGRATPATWQGCVWDRDQTSNYDTIDTLSSTTDFNQLHPAGNCRSNTLARILPLTDVRTNTSTLMAGLASMQPSGNTNLTPGIAWGMATLTSNSPFTEAKAPAATLKKFMILLTDGTNTESKFSSSDTVIDPRALAACTYVKSQNVTVYSIRVIDGNRTLLENCATSISYYKEVANAAQLTPVFEAIAKEIGAVRLTN